MASGKPLLSRTHSRYPCPASCPRHLPSRNTNLEHHQQFQAHSKQALPMRPPCAPPWAVSPFLGLQSVHREVEWLPITPTVSPQYCSPNRTRRRWYHTHSCLLPKALWGTGPCLASRGRRVPWYLPSLHLPGILLYPFIRTQAMTLGPHCNPGSPITSESSSQPHLQSPYST